MLYVIILYMYLLMQRIKIYVIGNSERFFFFFCKRRIKFLLLLILSNDCTSVRTAAWIFFSLSHSSLFLSLSLSPVWFPSRFVSVSSFTSFSLCMYLLVYVSAVYVVLSPSSVSLSHQSSFYIPCSKYSCIFRKTYFLEYNIIVSSENTTSWERLYRRKYIFLEIMIKCSSL